MKKCYIAKKWELASAPGNYRYSLKLYNPIQDTCYQTGKYCMTMGQLLSHINCPDLDQWNYVTQITICGFTVTSYHYQETDSKEEVQMLVIEYRPLYSTKAVDSIEENIAEANIGAGGNTMGEKRFSFEVNSEEFREIYNTLLDVKKTLDAKNTSAEECKETQEPLYHRYTTISKLTARMRDSMDDWLLHNQYHPYTKWRLAQLRQRSEEMIRLFDLEENENEK